MYINNSARRRRVPGPQGETSRKIAALSGAEAAAAGSSPISAYGAKLAQGLISTVEGMPDAVRTKMLRAAMDNIDPRLHAEAAKHAEAEERAGVPPKLALQRGIALAASQGLGREIFALGKSKTIAKRSQLGCLPCMALAGIQMPMLQMQMQVKTDPTLDPSTFVIKPGYTWVAATGTVPAHWERLRAGQTPQPGPNVATGVPVGQQGGVTVTNADGTAAGGKVVAAPASGADASGKVPSLSIGPFTVPLATFSTLGASAPAVWPLSSMGTAGSITYHMPLPDEWQQPIIDILSKDNGRFTSSMRPSGPGTRLGDLADFLPNLPGSINQGYIGVDGNGGKRPDGPLVKFKHPITGEDWGIYFTLTAKNPNSDPWGKPNNPPALRIEFFKINDSLWQECLSVVATVVNFAEDAAKWVGNETCALLSGSIGQVAAVAAGTVAGSYAGNPKAGAQIATVGVGIAAGACAGSSPPAPVATVAPSSMMLPLLLLGGAGVAAFLMLRKKK